MLRGFDTEAHELLTRHRQMWHQHGAAVRLWWAEQSQAVREEIWAKHLRCAIDDSSSDLLFTDVQDAWDHLMEGRVDQCTQLLFETFDLMLDPGFCQADEQKLTEPMLEASRRASLAGDASTVQTSQELLAHTDYIRHMQSRRTHFFVPLCKELLNGYLKRQQVRGGGPHAMMMMMAQRSKPWWCGDCNIGRRGGTTLEVYEPFLRAFHRKQRSTSRAETESAHNEMLDALYAAFFYNPCFLYYLTRSRRHPAPAMDCDVRAHPNGTRTTAVHAGR